MVALHRGAEFVTGVACQGKNTAYINLGSQIQAVLEDIRQKDVSVLGKIIAAQPA